MRISDWSSDVCSSDLGLMTGLVRRSGRSVRLARTIIEGSVLVSGFLLGGTLGMGPVAYMLLIGPLIQAMLPWFDPHARVPPALPAPCVALAPQCRPPQGLVPGVARRPGRPTEPSARDHDFPS